MKKLIAPLVAAVVVASSAFAGFGIPKVNTGNSTANTIVNKGVDMGKNKAVEKLINDKLSQYRCVYPNDKAVQASDASCDWNKISGDLATWKNGLESTIVNKVQVNVMAHHKTSDSLAMDRARNICNKISQKVNWWDCQESTGVGSNDVMVSVSVR